VAVHRTGAGFVFEFDGEPELGGYTIELASRTPVSLVLQKSADGSAWREIAASGLNLEAGEGIHRRTLGVGSTASRTHHGRRGEGYRYYRLAVAAGAR
jgi:hypothetical protein